MSFEELDSYFCAQSDTFSQIRHEQIQQALYYVKHPYAKDPNTPATEFWKAFVSFVHTEHPDLQLVNKSPIKSKTGDWPVYYTMLNLNNQVYIQHKMDRGIIDLTFAGMANRQAELSDFLKSRIGDYENAGFGIAPAGKSAVLRAIHDKPLDFQISFDEQAETAKAHVDLLYRLHLIAKQFKREDVLELLENDTHTP